MQKQILTIKQAAKLLQVDPNTIYRWARAGKFPGSKIGKEWRVLHSDVLKFIETHKKRSQFFTESQKAELITALVGRREIPLKFEYFGEGADRYINFAHPKELGGESEYEIIRNNEKKFKSIFGDKTFNFIDFGCGDGKKAIFFMNHMIKPASVYAPLDISARMLEIATSTMKAVQSNTLLEAFESDFEQGNLATITYYLHRRYQNSNLIFFAGNTIGNISDAHRVLVNLRESMKDSDFLLVGLAYFNPKNIPLDSYNTEELLHMLWTIPEKLGINRSDAKIYWTYNDDERQLECQLEFIKDWHENFDVTPISFSKGQRIRLAISRRFTKEDIFELFAVAGFKIELLVHDKDNALVLVRPHTWEKKI